MWKEQKFTDLTIATECGAEFRCHRAVLAVASPVFDAMLSRDFKEGLSARIEMHDVLADEVSAMLDCVYSCGLSTTTNLCTVSALMHLADMYQISGVIDICLQMLLYSVGEDTVVEILHCLTKHRQGSPAVEAALDKVIQRVCSDLSLAKAVCTQEPPHHRRLVSSATQTTDSKTSGVGERSRRSPERTGLACPLLPALPGSATMDATIDEERVGLARPPPASPLLVGTTPDFTDGQACERLDWPGGLGAPGAPIPAAGLGAPGLERLVSTPEAVPPIPVEVAAGPIEVHSVSRESTVGPIDVLSVPQVSSHVVADEAEDVAEHPEAHATHRWGADDAPAAIGVEEAALVAEEQWASGVEHLIAKDLARSVSSGGQVSSAEPLASDEGEGSAVPCVVLAFQRHNHEFSDVLVGSDLGLELKKRGEDACPAWANGAKILVPGLTPEAMASGGVPPSGLRPWHVVVREGDREEVAAILQTLPYKLRPRQKTPASKLKGAVVRSGAAGSIGATGEDTHQDAPISEPTSSDSSGLAEPRIVVEKTFLHMLEPLSPRTSYTKSTSDAHGMVNHRAKGLR